MNLEIQELAIVITAKNYDPNLLNPGFLKYSGIVPDSWEITGQPIVTNRGSQIVFNNGIYIGAQPNRLMFVEALNNKEHDRSEVGALANRYIDILRNIEYQGVGINFRGYINLSHKENQSNNYLVEKFIVPGNWQNCGTSPVKAGLNLMFTYEDKQLNLSVNEAGLKMPESEQIPIVLFSGNFDYQLNNESLGEKLERLQNIVNNWHDDLEIYQNVVEKIISEPVKISRRKTKEKDKEVETAVPV